MVSLLGRTAGRVQPVITAPPSSNSCSRVPKPATVGLAATAVAAVAIVMAATDRGANAAEAMVIVLIVFPRIASLPTLFARTAALWVAPVDIRRVPGWTRLIAFRLIFSASTGSIRPEGSPGHCPAHRHGPEHA